MDNKFYLIINHAVFKTEIGSFINSYLLYVCIHIGSFAVLLRIAFSAKLNKLLGYICNTFTDNHKIFSSQKYFTCVGHMIKKNDS